MSVPRWHVGTGSLVCLAGTLAQVVLEIIIWASTHMSLHVIMWFTCQDIINLCPAIQLNSVQMFLSQAYSFRKKIIDTDTDWREITNCDACVTRGYFYTLN